MKMMKTNIKNITISQIRNQEKKKRQNIIQGVVQCNILYYETYNDPMTGAEGEKISSQRQINLMASVGNLAEYK